MNEVSLALLACIQNVAECKMGKAGGARRRNKTTFYISSINIHFYSLAMPSLEEEAEDLASQVFSPGLLVVHDAARGGEHDVAKLTGGQQIVGPLLDVVDRDIEARRDDAALVQATG